MGKLKYGLVAAVVLLAGYATHTLQRQQQRIELKTIEIQNTDTKLKKLKTDYDKVNSDIEQNKKTNDQKLQDLENQKSELERQLQAKREAQARLVATATVGIVQTAYAAPSGSHEAWMAQAGITASDYGYVNYIIGHESGWNPYAVNASSQAGGLPQALPYSKTGCAWGDAVCQLIWANNYAVGRYGSWGGAYQFWLQMHWW